MRIGRSLGLLVLAGALYAGVAAAGTLEIGPTSTTMVGQERTATLTVRNGGDEPVTVQIRAMDWTQRNGEDVHTPSTTLIASPPFATLQPGEAQTVRLLIDNVPSSATEQAFRLMIDEIPNNTVKVATGIRTTVLLLSPVFLSPSTQARPRLNWSMTRTPAGVVLTARNDGETHERLTDVKITMDGKVVGEGVAYGGYVLAKSSRSWTLPDSAGASAAEISGTGAFGPVNARVAAAR